MKLTNRTVAHVLESVMHKLGDDGQLTISHTGFKLCYPKDLAGERTFATKAGMDLVRHLLAQGPDTHDQVVDAIYEFYPRKRDPRASKRAIKKALMDLEIPAPTVTGRILFLMVATKIYALHCLNTHKSQTYIPYPLTWYNRQSYLNGAQTVMALMKTLPVPSLPSETEALTRIADMLSLSVSLRDVWNQPLKDHQISSVSTTSRWSRPQS